MATALQRRSVTNQFLLDNISWETYERLLREVGERRVRMTYDNGDLEIMTVSFTHENSGDLLGLFVRVLASELNMPLRGGRTTTLRTKLKKKGLEPDNCYWLAQWRTMRGKTKWQVDESAPPDLALEVDISRSSLNRMNIYAALKVPEVWRYNAKTLRVFCLDSDGEYVQRDNSPTFPTVPLEELVRFVKLSDTEDETTLLHRFTEWVRAEVLPRYQAWRQRSKKNGK